MTDNFEQEVWTTLHGIDVGPLTKENHGIQYIPWSVAWREIMNVYPRSNYQMDDRQIPSCDDDGPFATVEVSCALTIISNEDTVFQTRKTMWLPVMDSYGQHLATKNPTSRDISDAKMRCLVKCAGMHGFGLSMWSGEDYKVDGAMQNALDFMKNKSDYRMSLWRTAIVIKEAFAADDPSTAKEAWNECVEAEQRHLWIAETKGGFFTMAEKEWIRAAQGETPND